MLIRVCPSRPPSNFVGFSLFPFKQKCVQVCDAGRRTSILKIYRIGLKDPRPESQTNPDNGQNMSILKLRNFSKNNPYKKGQRNEVCASTAVYVLVEYRRYYREQTSMSVYRFSFIFTRTLFMNRLVIYPNVLILFLIRLLLYYDFVNNKLIRMFQHTFFRYSTETY